ncbi:hypothetical protein [Clostridium brassicae]|uniref:Uncharacterized protein n=1 Tax=Clostridium brassicae TaxID=2999072 RepID=A0ABT4D978_9CLOT|nr:hypothetical protein [Clostridium brassicae]MCY6958842.1 hypothetical protein [Clostridium brassicae]
MFKRGMQLKIRFKLGNGKGIKTFKGKIVILTKHFVVLQGEHYKTSFKFSDFKCGAAVVI